MTKKILIGLVAVGLIGFFVWAVRGLIKKEEELQVAQEQAKMSEQTGEESEGEQKEAENANEQLSVGAEDTGQSGSDSASEREAGEQVSEEGAGQTAVADDAAGDAVDDAAGGDAGGDAETTAAEATEVTTAGAATAESNSAEKETVETGQREDGLKIEVMKEGSGQRSVEKGDVVTVHYTGQLLNGKKFDSSLDRGVPFEFTIGEGKVIQGWERGILGMKVGEKRDLTIPSELGYGPAGAGNVIPPNADLIFEVELLGIK